MDEIRPDAYETAVVVDSGQVNLYMMMKMVMLMMKESAHAHCNQTTQADLYYTTCHGCVCHMAAINLLRSDFNSKSSQSKWILVREFGSNFQD